MAIATLATPEEAEACGMTTAEIDLIGMILRAKEDEDDFTITIARKASGGKVSWRVGMLARSDDHDFVGDRVGEGHGATFEDAYEKAWDNFDDVKQRLTLVTSGKDGGDDPVK